MQGKYQSPNDNSRSRQMRRWWLVVAILRSSAGVSLERLARETGVSERTVRRDLIALEAFGLPIHRGDEDDRNSVWVLMKGAACPICGRGTLKGAELRRELHAVRVADVNALHAVEA